MDGGILESAMNSGLVMHGSKYGMFVVALGPVVCGVSSAQASVVHSRRGEHCWWGSQWHLLIQQLRTRAGNDGSWIWWGAQSY